MTKRISLCINVNTDYGIKPQYVADIFDNSLVKVEKNCRIKTNNSIKLVEYAISVWDWDDETNNYMLNSLVTDKFNVVEAIDPGWNLKEKTISGLQDEVRIRLSTGIKINPNIQSGLRLFIIIGRTGEKTNGVLIEADQYLISDGILKLNIDHSNPIVCFGRLATISWDSLSSAQMGMIQKIRYFGLLEQFDIVSERFPLIDLVSFGKTIVEEYITKANSKTQIEFTQSQIESLLDACRNSFELYSKNADVDLDELFADTNLANNLYKSVAGITSKTEFVERFLQNNEDFRRACCELVRDETLIRYKEEIEKFQEAIDSKKKEIKILKEEESDLEKRIEMLKKNASEIESLVEKRNALMEELENKKRSFINSLIVQAIREASSESNGEGKETYLEIFPKYADTTSIEAKAFKAALESNLTACLSGDSIKNLAEFITAAIKCGMNIVTCNDPCGTIAECISSTLDGCRCSRVCITDSSLNLYQMRNITSRTISVNGALSSFDFRVFFLMNRVLDKILIFSCDDRALIDSAPPEMWAFAVIVDLSDFEFKGTNIRKHCSVENDEFLSLRQKNATAFTVPKKLSDLLSSGAITKSQFHALMNLGSATGDVDFIQNSLFITQLRQVTTVNRTASEFEKVFANE